MTEQKLKVYNFYTKIRNTETHKTIKQQFSIVAYNIKEAKELFEFAAEHKTFSNYWELIEISEIKRDFSKIKNDPYTMAHYYAMFTEFKKKAQEEE